MSKGATAVGATGRKGDAPVIPVLGAVSEMDRTPVEVFAREPDRVIALARALLESNLAV